ncbi:hypothetical protein B0H12DRAFT_1067045 [Mycena haematopus]|nr:hypothetical protein B0H12DRAFT_1067045 [Mycena haematopus]
MASISCHTPVQNHILWTITADTYRPRLPKLSEQAWDSISDDSDNSASTNRRMEWLGDSIISGRISWKLCEMFPAGNVEFYHTVKKYLVSNLTLTGLMRKIAIVEETCPLSKTSADVFETLVGALYSEHSQHGQEYKLYAWFDSTFVPLIIAAEAAYRVSKRSEACDHARGV